MTSSRSTRPTPCLVLLPLLLAGAGCDAPVTRLLRWVWSPDIVRDDVDQLVRLPDLPAPVDIWFGPRGVPHVSAPDRRAVAYAIGYLHGRDRRFQLELLKLAALGRLREMIGDRGGPLLRAVELRARAIGFERAGEQMLEGCSATERTWLTAYADGVNAATAREPLPMELVLLGHRPEPWRATDSAAITAMYSFSLAKDWELELARTALVVHQMETGGSAERALGIWPPRYRLPPHTAGRRREPDVVAALPALVPALRRYLQSWCAGRTAPATAPREVGHREGAGRDREPAPVPFGRGGDASNNWAMGGKWTGTGAAALASDPHMPFSLPSLGYLLHVRCTAGDGFEVIGAGLVGTPAISFGTNGRVAWGATANWADVTDVYVERPVPGHPDRYLWGEGDEPFERCEESFAIRQPDGTLRRETRVLRRTRHGAVLNDFVADLPGEFPVVALRWSHGHDLGLGTFDRLYRAGSVRESRQALLGFDAMVLHWALADRAGHVGYYGSARLPRRPTWLGTVAVPGWTGRYEWQGYVPPAELPWVEDPSAGFVATANNQVVDPGALDVPINSEGNIAFRAQRIRDVLAAGRGGRRPTAVSSALHLDGKDLGHAALLRLARPTLERLTTDRDPLVAAAARRLLAWDGTCRPDTPDATLSQSLVAHLVFELLHDEMASPTLRFVLDYFSIDAFVYSLITDPTNPAWDDRTTPTVETPPAVLERVLRRTVAALAERYGPDLATWTWSRAAPFRLRHWLDRAKILAPLLDRGPLPTRGAINTVFKHQFERGGMTTFPVRLGPVLRIDVDLADLTHSTMSLPGGESGRPISPHYDDLLPLWSNGTGVSMRLGFDSIESRTHGKLQLRRQASGR